MSKRVPQSKRLQLINKWLRGIEDDDFEVFPTKTEGKYIVRPRKEPLVKPPSEPSTEESSIEPQVEEQEVEEPTEEPTIKPPTKSLPKKITRPKPQSNNSAIFEAASTRCLRQAEDPTINMEILNQLKLLGEEIKSKREKKEQKRMIKEVMNKELYKRNQYTQPQYIQEPNFPSGNDIEEEPEDEPTRPPPPPPPPQPQPQLIRRRRNNIFSDIF